MQHAERSNHIVDAAVGAAEAGTAVGTAVDAAVDAAVDTAVDVAAGVVVDVCSTRSHYLPATADGRDLGSKSKHARAVGCGKEEARSQNGPMYQSS